MSKSTDNKIPLADMLLAMDTRNYDFYDALPEEQQKTFSPWLAMRYCSSVGGDNSDHYLLLTNEIVNKDFVAVSKHPALQWKLLAVCGIGKKQYHDFIAPGKKRVKNRIQQFLGEIYPLMKFSDLEMMEKMNTADELIQLAKTYGYPDDKIDEIFGK